MNKLVLRDETFKVKECKIWGYVGRKNEAWYIRWCVYVACEEKIRVWIDDGDEYSQILRPSMEANTLPIEVEHWHDLDGITVSSGPNVDFEYLDPNDSRPIYSIYVYEHNKCSNNVISFSDRRGSHFRVRWSGTAYTFGPRDDQFELDATAKFTGISMGSEIDDEADVDAGQLLEIFSNAIAIDGFVQGPIRFDRFTEDGVTTVSFEAKFTPVS